MYENVTLEEHIKSTMISKEWNTKNNGENMKKEKWSNILIKDNVQADQYR